MTREGRDGITLPSRPSNDASLDMGVPPRSSRLYGRSGRAALTAGTLSTVGDDVAREDVKRYVEVSDAHRDNPDVMPSDHEPREWYDEAERWRDAFRASGIESHTTPDEFRNELLAMARSAQPSLDVLPVVA